MNMLESMRVFSRIVELGSFSAVARENNIGQPAISKSIALLEKNLGVRLLDRSTNRLSPTEEGKRFYVRSKTVLEEYIDAIAEVRGESKRVAGTLRVNAPVGLGELRLNNLFVEFLKQHPDVKIDLMLNDRVVDLVEEGVDIAIRLGGALPPNVIARKISSSPRILTATPGYLKSSTPIRKPSDLTEHTYIEFAHSGFGNKLKIFSRNQEQTVSVQGRYRVNSSLALREALLQGIGFGVSPAWLVQDLLDNGSLVRLLPKSEMSEQIAHIVYPTRRYQPERTRAMIEFLTEQIPQLPGINRIK